MIALLLALQPVLHAPAKQTFVPTTPDVVIFFWDDVGARTVELLRAQSPSKLPTVDFLASVGTNFSRGYAYPMCAPARAAMIRGLWTPHNAGFGCHPETDGTGAGATGNTLPNGSTSLGKAMEGAGYNTAYFGRWGLGTYPADTGGDDHYAMTPGLWGFETWRAVVPDGTEACGGTGYSNWLRNDDGHVSYSSTYHTLALATEFISWWGNTPSPKFAFVSFQSAHDPFHVPPSNALPPSTTIPPTTTNRQKYELMIQSADYLMGAMISAIMIEDGDLSDTFLLFSADNGDPQAVPPSGYNSNRVKFSTFDGGIRVPYFAAGLGFDSGSSTQPVSIVDFGATITDLAGVCLEYPNPQGQSILPALDGLTLDRTWVYSGKGDGNHAVAEAQWKLRETPDGPDMGTDPDQFLYDLAADPFENSPIDPDAPGYEDVASRLRAALTEAKQ